MPHSIPAWAKRNRVPVDTLGQAAEAAAELIFPVLEARPDAEELRFGASRLRQAIRSWDSDYRTEEDFRLVYERLRDYFGQYGWEVTYLPVAAASDVEIPVQTLLFRPMPGDELSSLPEEGKSR